MAVMIRETFRIFGQHWARWLGVIVLALLPMLLLWFIMFQSISPMMTQLAASSTPYETIPPEQVEALLRSMGLAFVVICGLSLLIGIYETLIVLGLGTALASSDLRGENLSFDDALTIALTKRAMPLLGGLFVVGFAIFALYMVAGLLTMVCIGVVLLPLVLYVTLVWLPLLAPTMVLERGSFTRLLARAWFFGKKRIWLTLGVWTILGLMGFLVALISMVGMMPLLGNPEFMLDAAYGLPPTELIYSPLNIITSTVSMVLQLVFGVFMVIFFTVVYHDVRAQYDPPGSEAAIAAGDSPPPPESAFTGQDLVNVLVVTVVAGMVVCVMMVIMFALMSVLMVPIMGSIDPEVWENLALTMEAAQ
ncbi:hypothetical protein ACFLYO_10360 [Chloroflexota bacterium]